MHLSSAIHKFRRSRHWRMTNQSLKLQKAKPSSRVRHEGLVAMPSGWTHSTVEPSHYHNNVKSLKMFGFRLLCHQPQQSTSRHTRQVLIHWHAVAFSWPFPQCRIQLFTLQPQIQKYWPCRVYPLCFMQWQISTSHATYSHHAILSYLVIGVTKPRTSNAIFKLPKRSLTDLYSSITHIWYLFLQFSRVQEFKRA